MPGTEAFWFFVATGLLQVTVAARLAWEREAWKRVAALLFALNGLATFWTQAPPPQAGTAADVGLLLDGPTGVLVLVLAFAYPRPAHGFPAIAAAAAAYVAGLLLLGGTGVLGAPLFVSLYQGLPVFVGYAAFLLRVGVPFLRDPARFGALGAWVVAGFAVRMAEFPLRYLGTADPRSLAVGNPPFLAAVLLLLGAVLVFAAVLVARLPRAGDLRRDHGLLAGSLGLGLLLGLVDQVPGGLQGAAGDVGQRFSLVVVRPLFVAVGALGPRGTAALLLPLAAVGAAAALGAWVFTALVGPGALAVLLAAASGLAALLAAAYALASPRARAAADARGPPGAEGAPAGAGRLPPGVERWKLALLALQDASPRGTDERASRSGLAEVLRVAPRNVHRVVEDANAAGRRLEGLEGRALVGWTVRRGRGNQMKYFYHLTPQGAEVARRLAAEEPAVFASISRRA